MEFSKEALECRYFEYEEKVKGMNVEEFMEAWHSGLLGRVVWDLNESVITDCLRWVVNKYENANSQFLRDNYRRLSRQVENWFGSIRKGYEYIGLDYDKVLLDSSKVYSIQGLLFENIVGEIMDKLGIDIIPQHDIAGDGSTKIDYYEQSNNVGYECKLRDSTVFSSDSLNKYSPLLDKLYIVYLIDVGRKKETNYDNVEFIHVNELLTKVTDRSFVTEINAKLTEIVSTKVPVTVKTCGTCKNDFETIYPTQKYCSPACRKRAWRRKK